MPAVVMPAIEAVLSAAAWLERSTAMLAVVSDANWALVSAAHRLGRPRTFGVFQPHRYTRTLALGPDYPPAFQGLDEVVLCPVYAASEAPLPGGSIWDLYAHCR